MNAAWLHQRWVHSHEEDADGHRVFRPSAYPFPPSRGRRSIELRQDGTMRVRRPGAADRGTAGEGRWEMWGDTLSLLPDDAEPQHHKVVSLEPDRLVLDA